jgi:hypothetical protein
VRVDVEGLPLGWGGLLECLLLLEGLLLLEEGLLLECLLEGLPLGRSHGLLPWRGWYLDRSREYHLKSFENFAA